MEVHRDNGEFMKFYEECSAQLRASRHRFMQFLQKEDDELWQSQDFIRFLVDTTNELLMRQEQLLEMSRKLTEASQPRPRGSLAAIRRAV